MGKKVYAFTDKRFPYQKVKIIYEELKNVGQEYY